MEKSELMKIKGITESQADSVVKILACKSRDELETVPEYEAYYQRIGIHMYNPHTRNELKMQLCNIALNLYGVESFETESGEYCDYINTGETYDSTLIYFKGNFFVSSWGDIAETEGAK